MIIPLRERFLAKVTPDLDGPRPVDDAPCWLWTASLKTGGYGQIWVREQGRPAPAYRVAWELWFGPVPVGLELDHLCRVRRCVNPAHLEPVTHRVNAMRGGAPTVEVARSGRCIRGHPLVVGNIKTWTRNGKSYRTCRRCATDSQDRSARRKRGAL